MKTCRIWTVATAATFLFVAGCDGGGGGTGGTGGNNGGGGTTATGGAGGTAGTGGTAGAGGTTATGGAGGTTGSGGSGGAASLRWYTTCGDVVCGQASDDPGIADCTAQTEGKQCSTDGEACELGGNDCNVNLVCASEDPKAAGCPISLASKKHAIEYLSDADRDRIRDDVVTMPLATWKYNSEDPNDREHLGFIIDDQPLTSAAVRPSGERVDLYGYTSMAVAAIQAQNRQIRELQDELKQLREEVRSARADGACSAPARGAP